MSMMGRTSIVYEAIGLNKMNSDIKGSAKLMAGAALAMTASIAAVGVAVVKIGIPFEQMTLDAGAAMRATESEFKKMEAAAREAGATTEHTATAAASALKALGKAGLNASDAISSLGTVMNFKTAIGSLQSLEQATSNVVGSTIAMGLEMQDMAHVTDLFITAANTSLTDAALMGQSFEKVAGIANIYGMSVEDLTATLGVMANANLKGSLAGRQLKNTFANTSKAAAELGIENKGLIPTIRGVAEAGWGADKIMGIYGRIAMPAVVAILAKVSGTGKGSFAYFQNEMSHASDGMGATAEQAEKMRTSVGSQFAIVTSLVEDLALTLFEKYKPALLETIKITQTFLVENKAAFIGVADAAMKLVPVIGVGGSILVAMRLMPVAIGAASAAWAVFQSAIVGVSLATSGATGALTALNIPLSGVTIGATAASGALGVMKIALGGLFAVVAGWQLGSYLSDQFEEVRLVGLSWVDTTMRGFIEIEHGAKIAWAGMKTGFGVVMGEMLKIFAAFTTGAATAFKAIGGFDIAGPLDRASMALKRAAKDTSSLTGAFAEATAERRAAIEVHKEKISVMALEHQGYKTGADAARAAGEIKLAFIRSQGEAQKNATQKQIAGYSKVSEAEMIALDIRLKADEDFYKKTGVLSDELRKKKMAEIEEGVTQFRLGNSTEIQILEWKAKEIAKLDGKRSGVVEKQLKKEQKAFERAAKKRIKEAERTASRLLKEEEKFQNSISKFNLDAIKKNEKLLGESQKVFEEFIKKELDIKEISNASKEALDNVYYDTLQTVRKGDVESFTFAMNDIMAAKFKSVESFKEIDGLYSVYLAEQEIKNRDIRLEFYATAGNFSQEYYDAEIKRIDKHSAKLAAAGVSAVDVERQKTDAILALDIKKLESSSSFFDGVRLASIQSSQDMMTWADAGQSAFNTIQSSLEQGFGDAFKSLMEGPDTSELEAQLEGLQGEYEALGASIVDVNAQIVDTELATQDAIRNSRRATMTEFELFQDDKLKFTETVANAEKAILEENFQLAQNLFVEAQGIAGTLQRVVKDETAVAVAEIAGQFDGLRINFDDLEVSVMDFGKASETALGKSGNIFKSITAGAKNFEKDIQKINIAAAFGDVNKAKAAAANIIKNYDAIFKAGQSSIQDLMGEWDDYQKKIEDVNKEILGINESTEEKIRNLRRGTMDEQEQWNDQRLEFDQNYSEATRALEEGNFEFASELFEKSIGLAEKLATDSVGTLEGNTDIAISLMEQASAGATSALTSYQSAIGDSMTSVEGAISSTVNALGTVTTTMDGLSVSGVAIVGTLEENTGLAIGLMEEAGIGATTALEMEQAALSANMDKTGAEMAALSDKISSEGNKMGVDWGDVWDGMVSTVANSVAQMLLEWAAAEVIEIGGAAAGGLLNILTMRDGGEIPAQLPGGPDGIPAVLHPGEWVLPEGVVNRIKGAGLDGIEGLDNYFQPETYTQSEAYRMYRKSGAMDEDKEILGSMLGGMSGSEFESLSVEDLWKVIKGQQSRVSSLGQSQQGNEKEYEEYLLGNVQNTHLYGMMTGSNPEFIVKNFSSPSYDTVAGSNFISGGGDLDIGSMFSDDPAVAAGFNAALGSYAATLKDSIKTVAATAVASGGDMSLAINAGLGTLLSPAALTNALVSGADAAIISYFGLDPGSAEWGAKIAGIAGNMFLGPVGGAISHIVGNFVGDGIADGLNLRQDEWSRDIMESEMGYFAGRREYNATQHMYTGRGAGEGGVSTGGFSAAATGGAIGEDRGGFGGVSGGGWHDTVGEADGGIINKVMVPQGEDGIVGIQFGEGVVSKQGMKNLGTLNTGVFGGTEARFDQSGMGTPAGSAGDIFSGDARNAMMSELLLNDQVTRQGRTNELLREQVAEQKRSNSILTRIADLIEGGDEEGARLLKMLISKPDGVTRAMLNPLFTAADITNMGKRNFFSGVGI